MPFLSYPVSSRGLGDPWNYPSRLYDQHLGRGLFDIDLLSSVSRPGLQLRPRPGVNSHNSGLSEVKDEAEKFKVMLNVNHFKPEEISVKTVDNYIVIHGKHEEKTDEHGFVSREFTRRYMLPEGTEAVKVASKLTPDGVLTIEAPKKAIEAPKSNERIVPITLDKSAVESK